LISVASLPFRSVLVGTEKRDDICLAKSKLYEANRYHRGRDHCGPRGDGCYSACNGPGAGSRNASCVLFLALYTWGLSRDRYADELRLVSDPHLEADLSVLTRKKPLPELLPQLQFFG
jgi:hypothetical protein